MTSVPCELNVTIATNGKKETFETVQFRFTTKTARALERAANTGIGWLIAQGRSVEALVLMLCYGLQWQYPKMTEDKAVDIIDAYLEAGGNTKVLSEAVTKALHESGVYGREEDTTPSPFVTSTSTATETPVAS